jgi:hypothetical protein
MPSGALRLGCAGGYLEGRLEPGLQLAMHGNCDYLGLEALNEASLSVLQRARAADPNAGFHQRGVDSVVALSAANEGRSRIITSIGAANPAAGAATVLRALRETGDLRTVGFVEGDDLTDRLPVLASTGSIADMAGRPLAPDDIEGVFAASAYLGAYPIAAALELGAEVVVTGRVVDSALYLGPALYEFGWSSSDLDLLAAASVAGHLLECAGHLAGGNYWGPGWKSIDYRNIGHGIAELSSDGELVVTKLSSASGLITRHTVAQQLLYEIGDPSAYLLPDVTVDVRDVRLVNRGTNRVAVEGVRGHAAPATSKVLLSRRAGFIAQATATFTWPDAVVKARRAADSLSSRLIDRHGLPEHQIDLLGAGGLVPTGADPATVAEVTLRAAVAATTEAHANLLYSEFANFYDCAPAGASGVSGPTAGTVSSARERIEIRPCLVPTAELEPRVELLTYSPRINDRG